MNKNLDKNLFSTNSLGLASGLQYFGLKIEKFDRTFPSKIIFFFNRSPKLEKIKNNFLIGNLKVEPKKYLDEIKKIKSIIYENL